VSPRDLAVMGAVIGAFALFVVAHVTIAFGLLRRGPRVKKRVALAALVVAPLAPYFAIRERMGVRAALWIGALVTYVAARVIAAS
jgi:hypothetical protein